MDAADLKTSPYGRKVMVVAHEKQLMDRLDVTQIDPWSDPAELLAVTPLGKVPALVTDDGTLITESATISEYFDAVGSGPALIGGDRFEVMARSALAQGLVDAAFGSVIERRRPASRHRTTGSRANAARSSARSKSSCPLSTGSISATSRSPARWLISISACPRSRGGSRIPRSANGSTKSIGGRPCRRRRRNAVSGMRPFAHVLPSPGAEA
jgi:hypothetical protein